MNYKAAILKTKVAAAPASSKSKAEPKEEPKEARTYRIPSDLSGHAGYTMSTRAHRIPSYFAEDEHRYRVFSEEEADYLDRCSPTDKGRVITLLKSGKLRIGWDVCYDDVTMRVTKRPKATMVSRKGSVKA